MEEHEHRWCRETGSSALVCVGCGSVFDHGALTPPREDLDLEWLHEFFADCGCSPAMSEMVNDWVAERT